MLSLKSAEMYESQNEFEVQKVSKLRKQNEFLRNP